MNTGEFEEVVSAVLGKNFRFLPSGVLMLRVVRQLDMERLLSVDPYRGDRAATLHRLAEIGKQMQEEAYPELAKLLKASEAELERAYAELAKEHARREALEELIIKLKGTNHAP